MENSKKGLGTASMVLGIVALSLGTIAIILWLLFWWLHFITIPMGLIGLVLGLVATIKKQGGRAIAGLVMNSIVIVACVVAIIIVLL